MKKKRLYAVILACLLASFLYDKQMILFITQHRINFINEFMIWLTNPLTSITIFLVMTTLFLWEERKRRWIIPLWLSIAISSAVTLVLKAAVLRQRPFEALILPMIKGADYTFAAWNTSFPSLHATALFSLLPILGKEFPKLKFFWIIIALLIVFSRFYMGVHYISDILAGSLIGLLAGYSILNFERKHGLFKKWIKKKSWK